MAQELNQPHTISPAELMQAAEAVARSGRRQIVRIDGKRLTIAPLRPADADLTREPKAGKPRKNRERGTFTSDDALFRLIGIGDSGIEGGISARKHEYLGKLRHT